MSELRLDPNVTFWEHDIVDAVFWKHAVEGGYVFVEQHGWRVQRGPLPDLEALGRVVLRWTRGDGVNALVEADGVLVLLFAIGSRGSLSLTLAARRDAKERAGEVLATAKKLFPGLEVSGERVAITFWHHDGRSSRSSTRSFACPAWQDIAPNYSASTAADLKPLLARESAPAGGRLILWHGEPGTGKTFALRALAREWRDWCDIQYVMDPERLFDDSEYMTGVLLGEDDDGAADLGGEDDRWRLLVLEDTGELLAADAKMRQGQRLSRFLNLADGLMGQGLRTLVLVTTNESIGDLHPAVARAGRCASAVRFSRLPVGEAREWLRRRGAGTDAVTRETSIADLYAMIENRAPAPGARPPLGFAGGARRRPAVRHPG